MISPVIVCYKEKSFKIAGDYPYNILSIKRPGYRFLLLDHPSFIFEWECVPTNGVQDYEKLLLMGLSGKFKMSRTYPFEIFETEKFTLDPYNFILELHGRLTPC